MISNIPEKSYDRWLDKTKSSGRIQQKMSRFCSCSISIFVSVVLPENSCYFACRGPAMKSNHQLRAFPVETSNNYLVFNS